MAFCDSLFLRQLLAYTTSGVEVIRLCLSLAVFISPAVLNVLGEKFNIMTFAQMDLGYITPAGGIAFLLGWVYLSLGALRKP